MIKIRQFLNLLLGVFFKIGVVYTSAGIVIIPNNFLKTCKRYEINPDEYNKKEVEIRRSREWALTPPAWRHDFIEESLKRDFCLNPSVSKELFHQYMQHYVSRAVCTEVIKNDFYGIRKIKKDGFIPKVIFDIGSSWGIFTMHAKAVWPDAEVYCFEPDKERYNFCLRNTQRLKKVYCYNCALIGFYEKENTQKAEKEISGRDDMYKKQYVSMANAVSLNEFFAAHREVPKNIDLIKIDIEGGEVGVLNELGEMGLLRNVRKVVGEWHLDYAKNRIPQIFSSTHSVHVLEPKGKDWDYFEANRYE